MNKFLNIGNIVLGADVNYVSIDALGGTITLSYSDKQIVLTLASTPTQVDKNAINTAIVAAWSAIDLACCFSPTGAFSGDEPFKHSIR